MTAMPAIASVDQRTVLTRFARGDSIEQIGATHPTLGQSQVADIVTNIAGMDRGRARAAVLAYDAQQRALTKEPTTTGSGKPGIEDLLTTAEKSGMARAERLAARIRSSVGELEAVLRDFEEERVLRSTREVLRQHLAKLDNDLRQLKSGVKPKSEAKSAKTNGVAPGSEATPKAIREWCRINGIDCPAQGRIPRTIQARYEEAQP